MTTKELLYEFTQLLLEERNNYTSLNEVKTFKRGVLPNVPVFPAIAILPSVERFDFQHSGNKYYLAREFAIELYHKGLTGLIAKKTVDKVGEDLETVLKDKYTLNNQVISNTLIQRYNSTEKSTAGDTINLSIYNWEVISKEAVPTHTVANEWVYWNENNFITQFIDLIKTKRNESYEGFNFIKDVFYGLYNISNHDLWVNFAINYKDIQPNFTGLDLHVIELVVQVFSKALDKDFALNYNLDVVNGFKQFFMQNQSFFGYAIDSYPTRINYDIAIYKRVGRVYRTDMYYNLECLQKTKRL